MKLEIALFLTSKLFALAFLFQSLEMFFILRRKEFFEIWSYENIKSDLERGLPGPHKFTGTIFSNKNFIYLVVLQILCTTGFFFFPHAIWLIFLFVLQLLCSIRFRGTFNGGSDMMSFVLLTGLLITYLSATPDSQNLGLIYIAICAVYSYFKAGLAKVMENDWRSGKALPAFLNRSLFADVRRLSMWLKPKAEIIFLLAWGTMAFELSILLLFLKPQLVVVYFLFALFFHFMVYMAFGLNRFFWIWLCAWPSIFYCALNLFHS